MSNRTPTARECIQREAQELGICPERLAALAEPHSSTLAEWMTIDAQIREPDWRADYGTIREDYDQRNERRAEAGMVWAFDLLERVWLWVTERPLAGIALVVLVGALALYLAPRP